MEKSNEWYTPPYIIEAAREVMGGIELDPASCALAQETVRAERYYSKEDDGLSQEWKAKTVWLNPPYGREYGKAGTGAFLRKAIEEYKNQHVKTCIILTMIGMYTDWFYALLEYPMCYLKQRPVFLCVDGSMMHHRYTSCLVYLGPNEQKFIDVFSKLGTVVRRVS